MAEPADAVRAEQAVDREPVPADRVHVRPAAEARDRPPRRGEQPAYHRPERPRAGDQDLVRARHARDDTSPPGVRQADRRDSVRRS